MAKVAKQTTKHRAQKPKHKSNKTPRPHKTHSTRKSKVVPVSRIRNCLQTAKHIVWEAGGQLKYVVDSAAGRKCFWFLVGTVVASRFVFQVDAKDS